MKPTFLRSHLSSAGVHLEGAPLPMMNAASPSGSAEHTKAWGAFHGTSESSVHIHHRSAVGMSAAHRMSATPPSNEYKKAWETLHGRLDGIRSRVSVEMSATEEDQDGLSDDYKLYRKAWGARHELEEADARVKEADRTLMPSGTLFMSGRGVTMSAVHDSGPSADYKNRWTALHERPQL